VAQLAGVGHCGKLSPGAVGALRKGEDSGRGRHSQWSSTPSAISDGRNHGHRTGMRASLVSREVIGRIPLNWSAADNCSTRGCVVGCDKTIPAAAMALARMDLPGLGNFMRHHRYPAATAARTFTIQDVLRSCRRKCRREKSQIKNCTTWRDVACPGSGAVAGQYTANTNVPVMEMIGLSSHGLQQRARDGTDKRSVAFDCGKVVMNLAAKGIRAAEKILTSRCL